MFSLFHFTSQDIVIKGTILDASSFEPLPNTLISIEGLTNETVSDENGVFQLDQPGIDGTIILIISRPGYMPQRIPVKRNGNENKDIGTILLQVDMFREQLLLGTISISDVQLSEDEGSVDNVAGLLQASRDVFLNAAAFDFSQTFFRPRGLDSEYGKVYINGIEMNKMFSGRPLWSTWGGLNDAQRNQVFTIGLAPSEVGFGGLAGSTNIIMRASKYGKGGRVSYALANRSYMGRIMGTYNSGESSGGWAYSLSLSRRFAREAFIDGTLYDANSLFVSIEKRISTAQSLNFTGFYTPNIRGKSSPNTQEVYDLMGNKYNSYWGIQDGEIRNSRIKEVKEPVFMLNHYWQLSNNSEINTNLAYQFGKVANTRIDYGGTRLVIQPDGQESFIGGGGNPDPTYFQKLPSYFLRLPHNQNYMGAYMAQRQIKENGQLNWLALYDTNIISTSNGGNSVYILAEDRNDDRQMTFNSIFNQTFSQNIKFTGKISYSRLVSENFASVKDLLGGRAYLDIDFFAQGRAGQSLGDRAQSDLQQRNRLVGEGDRFKYNFEMHAARAEAFSNLEFKYKKADFYLSGNVSHTNYWRNGLFQNGSHPDNSLGKSAVLEFFNYGLKSGGTYRFTGRHLLDINLGYLKNPPNLRNVFSNSRQNNNIVQNLKNEGLLSGDLSYIYRTPRFRTKFTGYFTQISNSTEISFYYADGLGDLGNAMTSAFVQEVLTGIEKRHFGVEAGIDFQVTSTIKVKSAAALGQYTYNNDPLLYITSDVFTEAVSYGRANLKNYRIAGGPQRAAQLGFEYRDPNYWWFGTTVNYFSHAFADISTITRTSNFLTDVDGLPILNYDESVARDLLKQEQFDDYILVNAIGGKSWRKKSNYIGFFISLNNILDVLYKTGGFEQSRNANYRTLKEDREREHPLFGTKYWYGTGASYYMNIYYRF
ncbi:carboxypeptidase-like regulatory domain-containing protein [soil metagenome]